MKRQTAPPPTQEDWPFLLWQIRLFRYKFLLLFIFIESVIYFASRFGIRAQIGVVARYTERDGLCRRDEAFTVP